MEAQSVVPLLCEGTAPSTRPTDALPCPPPRASQPPTSRGSDFCVHLEPGLQHLLSVQRERAHFPYGWGSVSLSHGGVSLDVTSDPLAS